MSRMKAASTSRSRKALRVIGAVILILALICLLAGLFADNFFPVLIGGFLAIPGGLLLAIGSYGGHERSVWLRLYALDYRECASCKEPLEGLPDGPCPNCKIQFEANSRRAKYPAPPDDVDPDAVMEEAGWVPGKGPARDKPLELSSRWSFGFWLVVAVGALLAMLFAHRFAGPRVGTIIAFAAQAVYAVGLAFTMVAWRNRKAGRVIALDFLVCTRCGFDLRGLAASGRCPECNRAYTAHGLRIRWLSKIPIGPRVNLEATKHRWLKAHPADSLVRVQSETPAPDGTPKAS